MTDDIVDQIRAHPYENANAATWQLLYKAVDEIEHLRNSYFMLVQWRDLANEFGMAASYSRANNRLEEFRRRRCLAVWDLLHELDPDHV